MTELSPAARAVLDAITAVSPAPADEIAAVAFCTLANHQQAPIAHGEPIDHWSPDDRTRRELRNLADELEGADGQ